MRSALRAGRLDALPTEREGVVAREMARPGRERFDARGARLPERPLLQRAAEAPILECKRVHRRRGPRIVAGERHLHDGGHKRGRQRGLSEDRAEDVEDPVDFEVREELQDVGLGLLERPALEALARDVEAVRERAAVRRRRDHSRIVQADRDQRRQVVRDRFAQRPHHGRGRRPGLRGRAREVQASGDETGRAAAEVIRPGVTRQLGSDRRFGEESVARGGLPRRREQELTEIRDRGLGVEGPGKQVGQRRPLVGPVRPTEAEAFDPFRHPLLGGLARGRAKLLQQEIEVVDLLFGAVSASDPSGSKACSTLGASSTPGRSRPWCQYGIG